VIGDGESGLDQTRLKAQNQADGAQARIMNVRRRLNSKRSLCWNMRRVSLTMRNNFFGIFCRGKENKKKRTLGCLRSHTQQIPYTASLSLTISCLESRSA
jgi:hypothetical protein